MIKKISDLLVISDLDNTLLTAKEGIPSYNIEMIEKFQKLGGKFTVATGRTVESVSRYLSDIKFNAPAITYNGGVIYDFENNSILYQTVLPESAKKALDILLENFPDVGCEIMCDNFRIYLIKENEYTYWHLVDEKLSYISTDLSQITNKWIKVLFADKNERLLEMKEFCENNINFDDIEFVMTNSIYFEMMPKNVTKGKALKKFCDLTNIPITNTIAVGDYYNDVEILKTAGLSVCVDNAPEDIKKLCHITVPACIEGGVGHLLAQIINSYI
ncbi:MAG: Cof-type HAD-IIB family hydrolase [Oscillospiraceae bacterium]|nr:Cof-type HAD-IIB family hydrolase [Oscillospiraceae bacterium]